MTQKINIFGIDITVLSAKGAMKSAMQYMDEESLNTVEILTLDMLMQKRDDEVWREQVQKFDLLLPGEKALLDVMENCDRALIKDVESGTFLRMFFKYLQKNKKRIFLLAESQDKLEQMQGNLKKYNHGLLVAGQAVLPAEGGLEENVINEINGIEPDCILSGLPSPRGEQFVIAGKALLNARLWVGGIAALSGVKAGKLTNRIGQFIRRKVFCYQIEKQKNDGSDIR